MTHFNMLIFKKSAFLIFEVIGSCVTDVNPIYWCYCTFFKFWNSVNSPQKIIFFLFSFRGQNFVIKWSQWDWQGVPLLIVLNGCRSLAGTAAYSAAFITASLASTMVQAVITLSLNRKSGLILTPLPPDHAEVGA